MNHKANIWLIGGLLLLAAALCTAAYHLWDGNRAADSAAKAVRQIEERIAPPGPSAPVREAPEREGAETVPSGSAAPEAEPPVLDIDGDQYIGVLELPSLGVTVPVMSGWSYPKLKLSPCRFSGSVYADDMIVAGHNYPAHFGGLKDLNAGDEIIFTDAEGLRFFYTVSRVETIGSSELESLNAGEWALTLFTCTADGRRRVTVRCERAQAQ